MDELELETTFSLGDIVYKDRDLYNEICQSYLDLFGISIKVLDDSGEVLFDVSGSTDFCQEVFRIPPCRQACLRLVNNIRRELPEFRSVTTTRCFTGAEYRLAPIHHETDVIGKVVFGPFIPFGMTALHKDLFQLDPTLDPTAIRNAIKSCPRMQPHQANLVARNIATVFEVIAFIGYKGLMTTNMHVQSLSEAFTELQEKNTRLEEHVRKLNSLNEQRANFLATISQEVRAPLTNLIGYAEMLQEGVGGDLSEDQEEFLATIIEQGEQIFGTTQTMDELSLIERNQIDISPQAVSATEFMMPVLERFVKSGRSRDIAVRLVSPLDTLPSLQIDLRKARSILQHILDNALKFTPAGGQVLIRTEEIAGELVAGAPNDTNFVAISVRDSGIGMTKEQVGRAFEPFFTAHRDPDRALAGSGVGLTIAKAYTQAHGGLIRIQSVVDQGTQVTVLLPIAEDDFR